MRVYVETTVWSFAFAEDSPDYAASTRQFFDACRSGRFSTMIGPTVLDELGRADEPIRTRLVDLVKEIAPQRLLASSEAIALSTEFLKHGAVPPSKPDDASHVAYAVVAEADVLVSWNFKHIVNLRRSDKFNAIALFNGYRKGLRIVTPSEVAYDTE
ncbi:MAG: PIN domain-containing protein [Phycisphaerales bacterium]|nr:PIN domain-containing protein [Phycisphaerales bacterium]